MINLNDFSSSNEQKEIKIFNNGEAGRVTNVAVSVKKKSPEDKPTSPDYKIFFKDENGEMNEGVYYLKETDNAVEFKMGRLIQIMYAVNPDTVNVELPQFPNYEKAIDFLMQKINEGSKKGNRVNVFVAYGNQGYPKQYLTLRGINFIENSVVEEIQSRLKPVQSTDESKIQYNDVMVRPTPDAAPTTDDVFNVDSESGNIEQAAEVDDADFF